MPREFSPRPVPPLPGSHHREDDVSVSADADFVAGVDTHLDTHTATISDGRGHLVAGRQVPASEAGYQELLAWARAQAAGRTLVWAVEGAGHYGLNPARHLAGGGETARRDQPHPARGQAASRENRRDRCAACGPRAA